MPLFMANPLSSLKLSSLSTTVAQWCLYAIIFLVPVFYLPWTSNVLEVNKQLILVVLAIVGGLSWLGGMLASKELHLRGSFINTLVIVYLVMYGLATALSKHKALSFFGYESNQYASFLSTLAFVIVYFLVANSARTVSSARWLFGAFLTSAFVVKFVALISMLGVPMPGVGESFNSVGSMFSLGVFSAIDLMLIAGFMLIESKEHRGLMPEGKWGVGTKVFMIVSVLLSLFILVALDFWVAWVMLVGGALLLLAFGMAYPSDFPDMSKFVMPMIALVVALVFLLINSPIRFNVPVEVSPSLKGSWVIARQALRDNPLLGSGPGTYSFDYAKYHDKSTNDSIFWNLRFDRANSHVMTNLATLGIFGTAVYLMMLFMVLIRGSLFVMRSKEREQRHMALVLMGVFLAAFLAKFLYASNMVLELVFWYLLGLMTISISDISLKKSFPEAPRLSLGLSFCFVLLLVVGVGFTYLTGQHYVADVKFTKALQLDKDGKSDDAIQQLADAALLDVYNDTYYRNLSQAELLKINDEAAKKATDDAERQKIARMVADLARASVNSALAAKDIAPANVANWSQLAYIYQNISPLFAGEELDKALDEAIKNYEEAAKLEPSNPVYPTQIGRILLAKADTSRQAEASKDAEEAKKAKAATGELLGKAEDKFNAAVDLKKDYAPAHYSLALTYSAQNNTKGAIKKLEELVASAPRDIGVRFQLGLLYFADGQKDKAKQALESSLVLDSKFSNAMWYLAAIYEEDGDKAKALELIRKVAELNPDNALVKARLEKLESGKTDKTKALPEPVGAPEPSADVGTKQPTSKTTTP